MRSLATAVLATMVVAGCGPRPEAFPAKTPEELKQLTDVTDKVVLLMRNVAEGTGRSAERDALMRQAIQAVSTASEQYRRHSAAIVTMENSDSRACIGAQSIGILDFETILGRYDEAVQRQDEVMASRRESMLQMLALDAGRCAVQSTMQLIEQEKRREALKHGAVMISEIYAIAFIVRAPTALKAGPFLKDQIRAYETLVAKLGPKHEVQLVTDALPKLKATLAMFDKNSPDVGAEPTSREP
jgi:hypothetical protein